MLRYKEQTFILFLLVILVLSACDYTLGEVIDEKIFTDINWALHVIYDGNGHTDGNVPEDVTDYEEGQDVTVLGNTGILIKTGYSFTGWNTEAGGNGTTYTQSQTFEIGSEDVLLYAKWTANPTWSVTYYGNGHTGGSVPEDGNTYEEGEVVTVLGNIGGLVKTGTPNFVLTGWNIDAGGSGINYPADSIFSMGTSNVDLYAQWTEAPLYTVTYDGNGYTSGSVPVDDESYEQGITYTVLGNTGSLYNIDGTTTAYRFDGWNSQTDGNGTNYTPGETYDMESSNVTMYAKWTPYAVRDTGPAGGIIFYDKTFYSNNWRYLEAAPASEEYPSVMWQDLEGNIRAGIGTAVGTGKENTDIIIANDTGDPPYAQAAMACIQEDYGGKSDWFMPAKDALNWLYIELFLEDVGGFSSGLYWSSSDSGDEEAMCLDFSTGVWDENYWKASGLRVRAVRRW